MRSWSQKTDSVPVKSVMEAERETAREVVVFMVVAVPRWDRPGSDRAAPSHGVNWPSHGVKLDQLNWMRSWSHTTASIAVKSVIELSNDSDSDPVVFTVAVEVEKGKRSGVPFSWMMAADAATVPEVPAERTLMRARRCQLLEVEVFVCVQIVVDPSLRVKVRSAPLGPGSALEPKASMVMTFPAAKCAGREGAGGIEQRLKAVRGPNGGAGCV
jgi:hypothetical protein